LGIGLKTHKLLWGKSGNRCAICKTVLYENSIETDNSALIGEECHIVAEKVDGPRGKSSLSIEERNKESNLILLCCNDHTKIDTEIDNFSVECLHKIKQDHESWVKETLNMHVDKSLLAICTTIEKIEQMINIKNWTNNFGGITYHPDCIISKQYYERLVEINDYLFKRFKIQQYSVIENELDNFQNILHDFINVFSKYINWGRIESSSYVTERFYKIDEWNPERYSILLDKYNFHIRLVIDLIIELTRSANKIIQLVREKIDIFYMQDSGQLLLHLGPDINLKEYKFIPLYENDEKYKGLKDFIIERLNRDKPVYSLSDNFIDEYI
jgi:hypothetical protein